MSARTHPEQRHRANRYPSDQVARSEHLGSLATDIDPGQYKFADEDGHTAIHLTPADELWIIVPPDNIANVAARYRPPPKDDESPGCGSLITRFPDETRHVPIPLKHTEVSATVLGYVASVTVEQQFHNPYSEKIEAEYVFPLPHDAAVNGFIMSIGDRRIRGVVRERAEAEQIYKAARAAGHVAALLAQDRPNIFTQRIANIEPGRSIDVEVTYFHTLAASEGWLEWVFPMVVGPRFNPPVEQEASGAAGDGIGAVARGGAGGSGQGAEVQYLRPRERSGHDIAVELTIAAGVEVEAVTSPSHEIRIVKESATRRRITLASHDTIPNKDLVVRYRIDGDAVKSGIVVQPDASGGGGCFAMMVVPPAGLEKLRRRPVEFVFVVDTSGSMKGRPLAIAREAIGAALGEMEEFDTFQVLRFSDSVSAFAAEPVRATRQNIDRAKDYVRGLESAGGTMMLDGINAALAYQGDFERTRYVVFLTDGFIGNEEEVLGALRAGLGSARVFSFGIGSSPNRHLLEEMGRVGRGAAAYVGLGEGADDAMELFFERVSHPALTDIAIDWGGLDAAEVFPDRVPDLFAGKPIVLVGRYRGDPASLASDPVMLTGRTGSTGASVAVSAVDDVADGPARGLESVWARQKIASMLGGGRHNDGGEVRHEVTSLALRYNLVSPFTSFLAVDASRITSGDHGTTVGVPVPVPAGTRYDTTVVE